MSKDIYLKTPSNDTIYLDGTDIYRAPNTDNDLTVPRLDIGSIFGTPVVLYRNTQGQSGTTSGSSSYTCTLSESYKNFNFIYIICRYNVNSSTDRLTMQSMMFATGQMAVGDKIHFELGWGGGSNGLGRRIMTIASNTRFTWGAGGYSNGTGNNYIVPFMIIGVR